MRENPDAEELLAEAEAYFKHREVAYEREQRVAVQSGRVLGANLGAAQAPVQPGSFICGVPLGGNRVCTQQVTANTKKCAAGHTPRRFRS